eukprot:scpid36716/ scgid20708/ 
MQKERRDKLLADAGLTCKAPVAGSDVALKADLHLTWHTLHKLRVWLKDFGVCLESERTIRKQIEKELPFAIVAESVPMINKHGQAELSPLVSVPDLHAQVMHYLDEHHKVGNLVWHDGGIASDLVVVKIGGDHGGGSFKLCFQIANFPNPNSLKNTVPVVFFEAKDSPANLATALKPYYAQIESLRHASWNEHSIKVVLFGDYEFQTHVFGLSGSSGVRPCLHCLETKKDFQVAPTERATGADSRDLARLATDHAASVESGGNISHARKYNNTIRPVLMPIPLEDACIPALHLALGIFPLLFECMLTDTNQVDIELATYIAKENTEHAHSQTSFTDLVDTHKELIACNEEINNMQQEKATVHNQLCWAAMHLPEDVETPQHMQLRAVVGGLQLKMQGLHKTSEELERKKVELEAKLTKPVKDGPCSRAYEPVLQVLNICRQHYHSGAFIGNHVHHALKPSAAKQITAAPCRHLEQHHPDAVGPQGSATVVAERYAALFTEFASCRNIYSASSKLSDMEIELLESSIVTFLSSVRRELVSRGLARITPKLHLLEEHVVPQIRHFGTGLGLYGEQGGEGIHAEFNTLNKRHASVVSPLDRLHTSIKQHFLTTLPSSIAVTPVAPTRKRSKTA